MRPRRQRGSGEIMPVGHVALGKRLTNAERTRFEPHHRAQPRRFYPQRRSISLTELYEGDRFARPDEQQHEGLPPGLLSLVDGRRIEGTERLAPAPGQRVPKRRIDRRFPRVSSAG